MKFIGLMVGLLSVGFVSLSLTLDGKLLPGFRILCFLVGFVVMTLALPLPFALWSDQKRSRKRKTPMPVTEEGEPLDDVAYQLGDDGELIELGAEKIKHDDGTA